jgi:hypothetical protein
VDNAPVCLAVRSRRRCPHPLHLSQTHAPATADDRVACSRLTRTPAKPAAHAANDGIAFTGEAFGSAACLAELLPIYLRRALSQIATSPIPTE